MATPTAASYSKHVINASSMYRIYIHIIAVTMWSILGYETNTEAGACMCLLSTLAVSGVSSAIPFPTWLHL